jgi:hypothetical protein
MLLGLATAINLNPVYSNPTLVGSCSNYTCLPSSTTTNFYSICTVYNSTGVYSSLPCNNYYYANNFCDTSTLDVNDPSTYVVYCSDPVTAYSNLYPGEAPCYQITDCLSNICQNSVCAGLPIGSFCSFNYQCQQGLSCSSLTGTCTNLIPPGQTGCTTDFDCVNTAGCDYNYTNGIGTCRLYFSVEIGDKIANCQNNTSLLCEEVQCSTSSDFISTCTPPLVSMNSAGTVCGAENQCADTASVYYTACTCGMNPNQNRYCQLFIGDEITQNLITYLKLWVQSNTILGCSSERRWDLMCMKNWDTTNYDNIKYWMLYYYNFTNVQENPDCVKNVFTYLYWDAFTNLQTSGGLTALAIGFYLAV